MSINQPTRVLSVFCSGFLSENLGRKKTLILGSICQILGGLSVFFSRSFTSLFVSVGFCGFFMCLIDTAKYSILSEICLIRFRDQLASIITFQRNFGWLIGIVLGLGKYLRSITNIVELPVPPRPVLYPSLICPLSVPYPSLTSPLPVS